MGMPLLSRIVQLGKVLSLILLSLFPNLGWGEYSQFKTQAIQRRQCMIQAALDLGFGPVDQRGIPLESVAATDHSLILDSNLLVSLPLYPASPTHQAGERRLQITRWLRRPGTHLVVTPSVVVEFLRYTPNQLPEEIRLLEPSQTHDSEVGLVLHEMLEKAKVGTTKHNRNGGLADRIHVVEALLANRTNSFQIPRFLTADKGIYERLCRFNRKCAKARRKRGDFYPPLPEQFPDGFEVKFEVGGESYRIWIIPVS